MLLDAKDLIPFHCYQTTDLSKINRMIRGYRSKEQCSSSPGTHVAYASVNRTSSAMSPLRNQGGTANSVNTHQTSSSHQSDEYNAALALLCLPVSSQGTGRGPRVNHSLITPQASFDSSRAIIFQDLPDVPKPPIVKQESTSTQSTPMASSAFYGSCSLSLPQDAEKLSPLHCFVRKFGIEAFVISERHAQDKDFWNARNFKAKPGIVGMRCMHCGHIPLRERGPKSVHYPSSTKCIYYSMENWQRHHAASCQYVPKSILRRLKHLMNESKTGSGGRRCYWADSAIMLGMVDTADGIKFASNPEVNAQISFTRMGHLILSNTSVSNAKVDDSSINVILVEDNDKAVISEYLFVLMSQMESCVFAEEDRAGSRSKVKDIKVGYPGMQCKHCNGKAGVGRYFPFSIQALSLANSDRNIHNHIKKCRRCPDIIKNSLERLRMDAHEPAQKTKRGSRKTFFINVWKRLHEFEGTNDGSNVGPIVDSQLDEKPASIGQEASRSNRTTNRKKSRPLNELKGSHHPRKYSMIEHPLRPDHLKNAQADFQNAQAARSEGYFQSPQATHIPVQVARKNSAYYANAEYSHNAFAAFHSESSYCPMAVPGVMEVNRYNRIPRNPDASLRAQSHREYHSHYNHIHFQRQHSESPSDNAMHRQSFSLPNIHQHQVPEAHRHPSMYNSLPPDWNYSDPPYGRYIVPKDKEL